MIFICVVEGGVCVQFMVMCACGLRGIQYVHVLPEGVIDTLAPLIFVDHFLTD